MYFPFHGDVRSADEHFYEDTIIAKHVIATMKGKYTPAVHDLTWTERERDRQADLLKFFQGNEAPFELGYYDTRNKYKHPLAVLFHGDYLRMRESRAKEIAIGFVVEKIMAMQPMDSW